MSATGKAALPDHDHTVDTSALDAADAALAARITALEKRPAQFTDTEAAMLRRMMAAAGGGGVIPPAPPAVVSGVVGSAFVMDGLANTQVGNGNAKTLYVFRAPVSSALKTVRYFHQMGSGYGAGTGGTMTIAVYALDGSDHPTGSALASESVAALGSSSVGRLITFASPASLSAGTKYGVQFQNTDASPSSNYSSVNHLWKHGGVGTPFIPKFPDGEWDSHYYDSSWHHRSGYSPVCDLGFTDGTHHGCGYMELCYGSGNVGQVSGSNYMVRQGLTGLGSIHISEVGVRGVIVSGGTVDLLATIETRAGVFVASASLDHTAFAAGTASSYDTSAPAGMDYVAAAISADLVAGTDYYLRLSCGSGSTFWFFPIRDGSSAYGYTAATVSGGYCEKTTNGSSWSSLGNNANQNDLQFYLAVTA